MNGLVSVNELYHHGILGMKWGVRRYQNKDGTLTAAGKKKYGQYKDLKKDSEHKKKIKAINEEHDRLTREIVSKYNKKDIDLYNSMVKSKSFKTTNEWVKAYNSYKKESDKVWDERNEALKKGKATYEDLKEKYANLYMDELGLKDVENGRKLYEKFKDMEYEEEYVSWRGKDY